MLRASSLVVAIIHPNGRREEITVDSDSATIGSGAHCEVRLPPEQAALEHLFIQARQGAIFAEARTLSPPPTMNGLPFTHGRLLPESVVVVGQIGLSMSLLQISDEVEIGKRSTRKRNPRTYVLGAVGIPLGLFYLANEYQTTDSHVAMPVGVPELWAPAETNCPQQAKEPGLAFALDQRARADAKRERSPFAPEDGVAAVPFYERAAACFKTAGRPDDEREAGADAAVLRRKLTDDFRLNRLRLERALATEDWDTARHQIRILEAFLGRHGDAAGAGGKLSAAAETIRTAFHNWLSNLDRRIALKAESAKKK
jgi:hypothetical protein